jgi:hypothetical protein
VVVAGTETPKCQKWAVRRREIVMLKIENGKVAAGPNAGQRVY